MKRVWVIVWMMAVLALLTSCVTRSVSPLARNEATAVPGLAMQLHAASASDNDQETVLVTLYYRYRDEPMLAAESRILTVQRDESVEFAIVQALLDGPSAGHSDLKALLPMGTTLESVTSRDDIIFVTFDAAFLADDVPADWMTNEAWREEAPIQRKLIAQSIVASLTEQYAYTGVQLLVHKTDEVQSNLRLDLSYFLTGANGPSDPLPREESLLLTPRNTAQILLTAWEQHDFAQLYAYVAEEDQPSFADFSQTLTTAPALQKYELSGGSITEDGKTSTFSVTLQTQVDGNSRYTQSYPLQLIRENSIWKIEYASLLALLAH